MRSTCLFLAIILLSASCSFSQNTDDTIAAIDASLSKGQTTISNVLSDEKYMNLHALTPFREVIKKHAKQEKVTMVTPTEPGKKITVKAAIKTADGKPLDDALVYLYHTSDKGWYSGTEAHIQSGGGDDQHARLFCYLKTNSKGEFEMQTIQPKGYPNSDLPAHIHIQAWKNGENVTGLPGEFLFDDDPRLTPQRRSSALRDGFLIEKNTGTAGKPVYFYQVQLRH